MTEKGENKKKRTRRPNGESSIYLGKDGRWHGRVTVGVRDDGTPDRRHVSRKTKADVHKAVRELEKMRDRGQIRKPGKAWTVATWMTHWVENIAALSVRENTLLGYRFAVNGHVLPGLGAHRLDRLTPEHLERFYAKMQAHGSAPATAHQAHRTIRAALNEAVRRGHLGKNPATLAKAPRVPEYEVQPYTVDEIRRIMLAASERRNGARWAVALALGLRQGEALGLRWDDVDLKTGVLWVRRTRLRPRYGHGCDGKCGRKAAGYCPERRRTNPETADTKSYAGKRAVGLPPQLVQLLEDHRNLQSKEKEEAGQLWQDEGWVFATETGTGTGTKRDYNEWKHLLRDAKVRDGRLHDARHTAATVLLILGVSERAVMGLMGWSSTSMAARYQHMVDSVRESIAKQVDGLLWEPESSSPPPTRGDV
ncbi:tyrosine-type recombinase/integrase [Streptomyces sp. 7N604]|uniref:tyrosine-type recombinase/integrase n=1 Tax=Streptomyces sp. 7N604 TaxID=3457415 RepID=UPI003FD2BAD7